MTWPQAVLCYIVCWWLVFYMALPIGVRPQENPEPGSSLSAPEKPYLAIKCAAVTILAALVTWGIDIVVHSGIVPVR